jgi:glycosyltransferase involved in cell wall biosynthesis
MIHPLVTKPTPVVSVVIPLYQKTRHIAAAICVAYRSCSLADVAFELVVVDDGSTDGSSEVVRDWAAGDPAHATQVGKLRVVKLSCFWMLMTLGRTITFQRC